MERFIMAKPTVKTEETKETKSKMGTGTRTNAGAVNETKAQSTTTVRLSLGKSGRDAFWYLKHEADLAEVTAEPRNDKFGITRIGVFPPSDAQAANGVIASIALETVIGTIRGIQIKESQNTAGALYLQTGSKNIAKADQPAKWFNEVNLEKTVSAQILSYVDSLLEKA
jgi:hypothetical protein